MSAARADLTLPLAPSLEGRGEYFFPSFRFGSTVGYLDAAPPIDPLCRLPSIVNTVG